jgi:hypothetical protein
MSTVAAAKIQQQKLAQVLAQKAGKGGGVGGAAGTGTDGEPLVITGIDVPPGQTLQSYPWSDIQFPSNFTMTKEEQSLMDMYALVRNCEREAGRYREQQAKAKLAAADEEFHKKQEAIAKDDNNEEEDKKDDDDNDVDAEDDSDHEDDDVDETGVASKPKIKIKRANIKRKRPTANLSDDESSNGDNDDDDDDEDNVDSFVDQEYAESKKAKVSAKKKKSKQQLAADDEADKEEEDRQREALLGYGGDNHRNNDPLGVAASLLLKKKSSSAMAFGAGGKGAPAASLLASAVSASTPVHDFSKKLAFDNNRDGTILFPFKSTKVDEESNVQSWSPPQDARRPTDRCLQMDLPDFDSTLMTNKVGRPNNTLAIKFTAPRDSQRFSLNIMGPDSNPKAKELTDVLVHFNPRRRERGGRLVVNDKQEGMWGKAVMIPLKEMPTQMFGPRNGSITLVIQINAEGFDFFVEGKHCARLDHRTPLPTGQCSLHLQFPSTDDYGSEYYDVSGWGSIIFIMFRQISNFSLFATPPSSFYART